MTSSPRILIARMSAIGDTILTMPLLCALREKFPHAHLAWVAEKKAAVTLRGHECLDQLIELDRLWFRSPSKLWRLRRQLQRERFDVAIDAQCRLKTAGACWLSGAPVRIGLGRPYAKECSHWLDNEIVPSTASHLVDRTLELLQPLGVRNPQVRFQYPIDQQSEEKIEKWLEDAGLWSGFVSINPGAGWVSRQWPAQRYGDVARHLGEIHHLPSVATWAGEQERSLAEVIVERSKGHALLAPPTSMSDSASLLRRAAFYIGSDTGPTHQAAVVGTPCVALHGVTSPSKSGAYGGKHIFLQRGAPVTGSRKQRQLGNDAMRLISVADVCRACDEMARRHVSSSARPCDRRLNGRSRLPARGVCVEKPLLGGV